MMKQNMRKGAALLLSLTLLCTLFLMCSGCGNKDKEALIGEWETTLDLTGFVNDELKAGMGGDEELMKYFTISDFTFTLTLTFGEDDSYSMAVDKASVEKSADNAISTLQDGFSKYLEDMLAQQYPDMTIDEFFEAAGMTQEQFYDQLFGEVLNKDNLVSSTDDMESSGTFEAKDGVLTLTDDDGPGTESYELDGDKLTLTGEGSEDSELADMFPLVFTKK